MTKKLIAQIIATIVGLWLANQFVFGVEITVLPDSSFFGIPLTQPWHIFLLLGTVLGLLNFFVKPILDVITMPLRIITLGLFGFVVNMGLVWIVDILFQEFSAPFIWPLVYTTLIIFALNIAVSIIFKKAQ